MIKMISKFIAHSLVSFRIAPNFTIFQISNHVYCQNYKELYITVINNKNWIVPAMESDETMFIHGSDPKAS